MTTDPTAIAVREAPTALVSSFMPPAEFEQLQVFSSVMHESGYFRDCRSAAQAMVKILLGRELGLGPGAAMASIQLVEGKPGLTSSAQLSLAYRHGFMPAVVQADAEAAILDWYHHGEPVGRSGFTMDEARSAKYWAGKDDGWQPLATKWNWQSYPSDMLFARAVTRGIRRFCPQVVLFGAYVDEELEGSGGHRHAPPSSSAPLEPEPIQQAELEPQQPESPAQPALFESPDQAAGYALEQEVYVSTGAARKAFIKLADGFEGADGAIDQEGLSAAWIQIVDERLAEKQRRRAAAQTE